jgi:hypothetical protein
MADLYFRRFTGEAVGQDRDKGASFMTLEHCINNVPPVSPQHTAIIMHFHAGGLLCHFVNDVGRLKPVPIGFG